ncbi:Hyalin [Holothuria leucospilota]|uniref:Hyalin n=1 Tax=Holothuria leucospilota TaxID=206669 RepID=A0A9Q1HBP3_HOLLE|nr:Hyalin [Holothuria leucospilota]
MLSSRFVESANGVLSNGKEGSQTEGKMATWTGLFLLIFISTGHGQEDPCLNNMCEPPSTCARSGNSSLCLCTGRAAGDFCEDTLFALETEVERFNAPSGTLLSPNFPDLTPDMLRFVYQIVQVPGAVSINFTINFFCLELMKDYLYYGPGNSPSLDVFPNEEGVPFLSGCENDTDIPSELVFEGDSVWFRLDTDLNIASPGYNITYLIEPSPPVITCPEPVFVESLDNNVGNTAVWLSPVCTSNGEPDNVTLQVECQPNSGSFFPGSTENTTSTVTCTCTNDRGRNDACDFDVTVIALPVNAAPVIICPPTVIEVSQPGNTGNTASWPLPTCGDAEQDPSTLQVTCTPPSGSLFPVGINTAMCICEDNEGASDTCDVTVIISTAANSDPVIMCPPDVTVVSLPGNAGNSASWPLPSCTDIDQDSSTLQVMCTPPSGSVFPVGSNTVTCECSDDQGAVDTCDIIVNVSPSANSNPVITCPGEVTVPTLPGNIGNAAFWTLPSCTDVDQDPTTLQVMCDPPSGDQFPIGRNVVTCTCEDDQAASVSCFVIVNVSRGTGDSVCDGNPCFPNECRPVERNGQTRYNCHGFVGSRCTIDD